MNWVISVNNLSDQLTYNRAYAPEYPEEDRTSLDQEEHLIRHWLQEAFTASARVQGVHHHWLSLAQVEISQAFEQYRCQNIRAARKSLNDGIRYLQDAVRRRPLRPDFMAGPDGAVKRTE